MKMSQWLIAAVLVSCTSQVFADKNQVKDARADSKEQAISVGNEQAAASGSHEENKTVRQKKARTGKASDTREHDVTVGNEKAAQHGSKSEDKSLKQKKAHTDKGKHKAKGRDKHDKKAPKAEDDSRPEELKD